MSRTPHFRGYPDAAISQQQKTRSGSSRILMTQTAESNEASSKNFHELHRHFDHTSKRDQAFIRGPALLSYRLFRGYLGPTTFSSCGAPTWFLSASTADLRPRQRGPSFALGEHFLRSAIGLSSSIWRSKRQSLDERHREFVLRTDRSMNGRSLDANFGLKLCVRAVCEARSLRTPAFIWNPAIISYTTVKLPAFKRDPAFIQIRRLFEEIRYTILCRIVSSMHMHTEVERITRDLSSTALNPWWIWFYIVLQYN